MSQTGKASAAAKPIGGATAHCVLALAGVVALAAGAGDARAQDAPIDLHAKSAKPSAKAPASAGDAVKRANAWFETARNLTADFVQIGPDGKRSEGQLYVSRPGHMLFRFAPPARLEIVADGRSVAVRDQKLNTQDLYFIGQTPLKFLLADHIDLARDTKVLRVEGDAHAEKILIEDKATFGGSAQIELVFDPASFALKQWTVNDAQGLTTVVSLFKLDLTSQPDPDLFHINELAPTGKR